jgi:hypothetical protein
MENATCERDSSDEDGADVPLPRDMADARRACKRPADDGLAAVRHPTAYVGRRRPYKTLTGKSVGPSLRRAITLPAPGPVRLARL